MTPGFFDRFKKPTPTQTLPVTPQTPAFVINPDNALPPKMEGEAPTEGKDIKEDLYEDYQDDETEEISVNPVEKQLEPEAQSIDTELETLHYEAEKLAQKIKLAEFKKAEAERKRVEEEKRKAVEAENLVPRPQYVPIYLSEAEFLREIMKRVQNIELWVQELSNNLKREEI
jgi:hypothetical protein